MSVKYCYNCMWIGLLLQVSSFSLPTRQLFKFNRGGQSSDVSLLKELNIPTKGLVDYIGDSSFENDLDLNPRIDEYSPPSNSQKVITRIGLWAQPPWNRIEHKNNILKIKLSGSLSIEPSAPPSVFDIGVHQDMELIQSLADITTILNYAAYDPRISAIFIDVGHLQCGYAKLTELRRALDFFRQSGKTITAYSESADQKTLYAALSMDALYVPPDGNVEVLGFAGEAQFYGGVFEKVGVEPQVQRIGKYKSYGDSLIRSNISAAQREVTSSILTEVSRHWAKEVASGRNKSVDQVRALWADKGIKTPYDYKELGFISGVRYIDQVEGMLRTQFSCKESRSLVSRAIYWLASLKDSKTVRAAKEAAPSAVQSEDATCDFNTSRDFDKHPRRGDMPGSDLANVAFVDRRYRLVSPDFVGGKTYLRKMRLGSRILQGLPIVEVSRGPRIAIINAAGGIGPGKGQAGVSIGADTLIEQIREARDDPDIRATVLRVDSPGGGALASDLIWRELRCLSRVKPVVASMVDVAASGGYYLAMACDRVVAEETTLTGSIGVVAGKFSGKELTNKIGLGVETISIGRYAEMHSLTQPLSTEEEAHFAASTQQAYLSFTSKAAASRNMTLAQMEEVAQGRVWTGRQALTRGLVDGIGGLRLALQLAANLTSDHLLPTPRDHHAPLRVQTLQPGGGRLRALARRRLSDAVMDVLMEPLLSEQRLQSQPLAVMDQSVHFVDMNSGARSEADRAVSAVRRLVGEVISGMLRK